MNRNRCHPDAPGVGTPVCGGAIYREAHLAMEILADHDRLLSFEIVEVNPILDEHNRTADLAVELACSAFGKKILRGVLHWFRTVFRVSRAVIKRQWQKNCV